MSARRAPQPGTSSSPKKQKSLSEIINEQFDEERLGGGDYASDGEDFDLGGRADDFDDLPEDATRVVSTSKPLTKRPRGATSAKDNDALPSKRLRRRGPLEASLSAGHYAAEPVAVEAMMEDIFGALEMGEEDDLDSPDTDAEENHPADTERKTAVWEGTLKRAAVGRGETEEAYISRLEAKQRERRRHRILSGGGGLSAEESILEQLESLRAAQMEVLPHNETAPNAAEDDPKLRERQRTQAAVQHYVMLYSQLLRVRLRLQPAVSRILAFPQYYALEAFINGASNPNEVSTLRRDVVREMRHLLHTLLTLAAGETSGAVPNGKETETSHEAVPSLNTRNAPSFPALDACHRRMMRRVDDCVEHWGAKLIRPAGPTLQSVAQPLLQQIRAILTARARLRTRAQRNRAHTHILGHPEHYRAAQTVEGKAARAMRIADGDPDAEVYEDGEFLREVVKRGGAARLEQQLRELESAVRTDAAPAKRGFHRLTKGKAVHYEPRPKLVGFMLPTPYALTGQHEAMMASLFQ